MNIVILAAGQGKRMHSKLPKVLHPLAGKPLVVHVIDTARKLSPQTLSIVYGHGGDLVRTTLSAPDLTFVLQEPQLGTGHAVAQAIPHLKDQEITLILYGDVPLIRSQTLQALTEKADRGLSILSANLVDPTGYGRIVRNSQGRIEAIVEQKDALADILKIHEVNTGIMAVSTLYLKKWLGQLSNDNAQKEYYLTDIVKMAVAEKLPVFTVHPDFEWEVLGVNSQLQLAELERLIQKNIADDLLEQGVHLADPARLDVRGKLVCGSDVFIDINCVFEGNVELGNGVIVGPNCVIKNAKIEEGAYIAAFTHIDEANIGAKGKIGPFARLRPGAQLAKGVHIGNFVEIKKSKIAEESKVNHLAYIGDATIGCRVNIGAGTITCNYDGVNKHETVIEDDVFIGSDTQLVAPVTVGRGAVLGAGTTLTKNVPEDTLTVSRVKQTSFSGWKRPVKLLE